MLQTLRSSLRSAFCATARRGFTLIEIAIVLVVIGLIVSGGLLAVSPVIQSAKINETKQKMGTVEAALLGYVIANGCLPCPAARGASATGVSNNGTADYTTQTCDTACFNSGVGLVPWVTLGIGEADAIDGWNRRLTYAVDTDLVATNSVRRDASGNFPSSAAPTLLVNGTYTSIAYVLVSHGRDATYGESPSGAAGSTAGASAEEIENGDNDLSFSVVNPDSAFDDLVRLNPCSR